MAGRPAAIGKPFAGRTALLSPFDRLVHDRRRALELFDFDYHLEMYVPKAKRRWGCFALPVLHHDRLVGKVDATGARPSSADAITPMTASASLNSRRVEASGRGIRATGAYEGPCGTS